MFDTLTASDLFGHAGSVALLGWAVLALGIVLRRPILRDLVAGLVIPAALSTLYTVLIAIHWWQGSGGFDSLQSVALLFQSEWLLLAGWVHFLAYDLFVGAWIARQAEARGITRLVMIPVLPLCFLFGPAGFLLWLMIRSVWPHDAQAYDPALSGKAAQ